jgi:hypothetical protein
MSHVVRALALALALLSLPASALPIHFDCYLPGVRGNCRDLESALVSSVGFLERGPREDAELIVTVRGAPVDAGVRYAIELKGVGPEEPAFTIYDRVPSSIPGDALLVRLVGDMQRGLAPFLELDKSAQSSGGAVELRLRDPDAAQIAQARPDESGTRWYVRPNASVNWAVAATERLNLFAGGRLNYSDPWWRLTLDLFSGYNSVDDKDLDSEPFIATFGGFVLGGVHTLDGGFSTRAQLLVAHDTNDNQRYTVRPLFGFEWVSRPFLESDTSNFGVRYQVGGEHVEFIQKNIRGRGVEDFLLHDATAFVSWHFDRVDLEVRGSFRSILDDIEFSRVSGSGSFTWRVTDELNLALNANAEYRNKLINAPAEESEDPLEQIFGGNFGAVSTSVNLSVAYTFGNALLDRQDRRWR